MTWHRNMQGVTYPSGHTDSLEVACRRAVLTGVNQTAAKLQLARADEMGCEFVEVTAHGGARPEHAAWQGKVYHRGGPITYKGRHYEGFEVATGYGTGPGLCGWNCRHNFFPFFPGISQPAYDAGTLEALSAKNIEYNGQMYSQYEVNQLQRGLERRVRDAKKQYLAEDAAGVDTAQSAARLASSRQQLKAFTRATGGRVDSARVGVSGFGRSQAGKATARVKIQSRNLDFIKNDAITKSQSGLPPKITNLQNCLIPHTITVEMEKLHGVVPKGTIAESVYVMAGKGTSTPIRDLRRLYFKYPEFGEASNWQKKSGVVYSKHHHYVIHWYENSGEIPLDEIKLKGAK